MTALARALVRMFGPFAVLCLSLALGGWGILQLVEAWGMWRAMR